MKESLREVSTSIGAFLLLVLIFGVMVILRFGVGYLMGWMIEWFTGPLYFTNGHVELPVITGITFMILTFVVRSGKGD